MKQLRIFPVLLLTFSFWIARAEPIRRALLIGNDSYPGNSLRNAKNDAKGVNNALKQIGYKTTLVLDADRKEMVRAIDSYTASIEPGDIALIYYAGHGMQMNGENYLIPVDFKLTSQTDPKQNAYSLTSLLEVITRHGATTQVVVLDACRNNPFLGDRSYGGGWASLGSSAGTFLAFGTSPGSTASDDPTSSHGLFTKSLLKYIATSPLDIEQMFQQVRLDVIRESSGQQVPWTASSLVGSFHMLPAQDQGAAILTDLAQVERQAGPKARTANGFLRSLKSSPDPEATISERVRYSPKLEAENEDSSMPDASLRPVGELVRGGKIDLAIDILQAAVAVTPAGNALRLLGLVLQLAHRNLEAVEVLDRALKLNPEDVSALTYRCIAAADTAPQEAMRDCEAAVKLSPSSAEAHLALSNLLLAQGQPQRAFTESERAIAVAPQDALGFALRGRISTAQNHEGLARQDFERATRLNSQNSSK